MVLNTSRDEFARFVPSMATGEMAFTKPKNKKKVLEILEKFDLKYGVKLVYYGINVNHLHLQINQLEGFGVQRFVARQMVAERWKYTRS